MEDYEPSDATPRAREVAARFPPRTSSASPEDGVRPPKGRRFRASSIDLRRGKRETARARGLSTIELGRERVDLSYLEQLAEPGQTEAVARIIGGFAAGQGHESREVADVVAEALASVSEKGLGSLGSFDGHPGEMSQPRAQELAAALNRIRSLDAAE